MKIRCLGSFGAPGLLAGDDDDDGADSQVWIVACAVYAAEK